MNDLIRLIRGWASARNLIKGSAAINQYAKLMSEVGEIASAVQTGNGVDIADGVGDAFVVLVIICAISGIDMEDCCANVLLDNAPSGSMPITAVQTEEFMWLAATLGKLGDAVLKKDNEQGRMLVINAVRGLNRIAVAQGQTFKECVQIAYDEIKDRKGIMYNGTFIKATDPRYASTLAEVSQET